MTIRVYAREIAIRMLTIEELDQISGGVSMSTSDTWCELFADVEQTDDCGRD